MDSNPEGKKVGMAFARTAGVFDPFETQQDINRYSILSLYVALALDAVVVAQVYYLSLVVDGAVHCKTDFEQYQLKRHGRIRSRFVLKHRGRTA